MKSFHDKMVDEIERRLRSLGYEVKQLPAQTDGKSADLLAWQGFDRMVVEVKTRRENIETKEELDRQPPGEWVGHQEPLTRENLLSGIAEQAANQILSSQHWQKGLGVMWFCPDPLLGIPDSAKRVEATLYGIRHAFVLKEGENVPFSTVYLATYNDFYRFQCIDAVVIDDGDGSRLLVNPFSLKKSEVRASRLYSFFKSGGAVTDLDKADPASGIFIVEGDFSRGDQGAVSRALGIQYPGYVFHFAPLQSLCGFMSIGQDHKEGGL